MKKNLMAVLTASSVAVMAVGATLAAYAEPDQEDQIKDENETYAYGVASHCLYINTFEGFENWQEDSRIERANIETISFENFSGANGSEIPAGAFEGLTSVTNVKFGTSISKIGDNAFKGCTSLVNIVFQPAGPLMTIGKSAFEGCTSISQLVFMGTMVGEIGESAFEGCTSISALQFMSSFVTRIGKSAFKGCTGLMDIGFGSELEEIGESAFEGCKNLGKVEKKPNKETNECDIKIVLHDVGFDNYKSSKLEAIGNRAFYGCEGLTIFQFPINVKTVGEYAFANCASLYAADMSSCDQLTNIEKYAFFNCLSLTEVHFPYSGNYFGGYNSSIPKHTIAEGAFRNCSWLEGVILSPHVGYVAPGAFYKCKNLGYIGYYVDEDHDIGANIKIKIDTEHSTQDPPNPPKKVESTVEEQSVRLLAASGEDSGTVTIYVPPEVTAFSYREMKSNEKKITLNEKVIEMFQEKLAENSLDLTYKGQIIVNYPNEPTKPYEPEEPVREYGGYYSNYEHRYISFKKDGIFDEELFASVCKLWEKEHDQWKTDCSQWEIDHKQWEQDYDAYMAWQNFLESEENEDVSALWWSVLDSEEYFKLQSKLGTYSNQLFCVTILNESTSKDGKPLDIIVLPEKFNNDVDIYSITKVDGNVDIVNIPVKGSKVDHNYVTCYYYDFTEIEAMGYKFAANYLLGPSVNRTYRDGSDIDDPTASGVYGNSSADTLIEKLNINSIGDLDDLNPTPSPSSSSTTTSSGNSSDTTTSSKDNPPPTSSTSNPPSPPPTPNTNDPIEPDPEPSEPESSEPESSEPESSEPESSEPESSEPESSEPESSEPKSSEPESSEPESSEPENNPPTGTRFLAPIVLAGAAVVVVAARRRKMK